MIAVVAAAGAFPTLSGTNAFATAPDETINNCGMEIALDPVPQRIFAINQTMIELTYALGAGDRVVANAFLDNAILPEFADQFADVEYFSGPPSREQVIAANPDLIVAQFPDNFTDQQMGSRASFAEMGIRTWLAEDQCPTEDGSLDIEQGEESFAKNFEAFRRFARILGPDAEEAAEQLISDQEAELAAIAADVETAAPRPRVAFVQFGSDNEVLVYGGGSMSQAIAEAAGVENVFADRIDGQPQVSVEQLIDAAPEYLIVTTCCGENLTEADVQVVIEEAKQNPALAVVPAVQREQFIALPFTSLYAGVRNVDAARAIADATHTDG